MTARPLNAVLRALADTGPPDTDADLLRRFVATRDDEAFAGLVRRHGRLVWAVCRHLTRSDAEADDAFQATFLVLVRNAAGVKDAAKLSAWLHGVAYKVCGKSRLSSKRRSARELATAGREGNGHAVPDSAWDRALAAVHEEVAGLPDTLRVPFVLCCLEGRGQTEAAEQLGWKLGTLSGRLTRAKNAVLERLSARGLTLGVLATVGMAAVPADVSAKAFGLGQIGYAVPSSVLQLSSGVIGMSINKVKLLAAGVLAACGLAVSGGAGWVASAGAQSALAPAKAQNPADRVKQLEAELQRAKAEAEQAAAAAAKAEAEARLRAKVAEAKAKADEELAKVYGEKEKTKAPKIADDATNTTRANDYLFVVVSPMDQTKFMAFLQKQEDKGWVFSGTTPMEDPKSLVWVFRRAKGGVSGSGAWAIPSGEPGQYYRYVAPAQPGQSGKYEYVPAAPKADPTAPAKPLPPAPPAPPTPPAKVAPPPATTKPADDAESIEAEIKRLQEKLEALKKSKSKKQ